MEILNLFGIETKLIIAQVINFAVLFIILKILLYKPVVAMLGERSKKIKQGLDDAENAKKMLKDADIRKIDIIKNANVDADKLLKNTRLSAQSVKQKTIDDAKREAGGIIDNAKRLAQEEFLNLNKQVGNMSVDISKKIVSQILSEVFGENDKNAVLSKAMDKIEQGGYEKGRN